MEGKLVIRCVGSKIGNQEKELLVSNSDWNMTEEDLSSIAHFSKHTEQDQKCKQETKSAAVFLFGCDSFRGPES